METLQEKEENKKMKKFYHYIFEETAKATISSKVGAANTERHTKKYFSPEMTDKTDYEMRVDHAGIPKGSKVKVTGTSVVNGVVHANVIHGGVQKQVPIHHFVKPKAGRGGKQKFSDEHAAAKAWNHFSKNPKLAADTKAMHAEIEKAKNDPNHPLHFDNQGHEGFSGGKRTEEHRDSYYQELKDAAHTVSAIASHPSMKHLLKNGGDAEVTGAARGKISDAFRAHGATAATSKADLHITDKKTGVVHRISLKKGESSQLMSAQPNEFHATIAHAVEQHAKSDPNFTAEHKADVIEKSKLVSKHMNDMNGASPEKQEQLRIKAQKIMDDIHKQHPNLLQHIHHEAATGKGKFGGHGSEGSAQFLVTTTSKGAHVHDTVTGTHPISASPIRIARPKGDGRPGNAKIDYKVGKE